MKRKSNKKRKQSRLTLLSVYDSDLNRLSARVGKDRSPKTFSALKQGRNYVSAYLRKQLNKDDIPLQELKPQFIYDFSAYLSAVRGLRGGTVWLACQQLKGVVTRAYQRGMLIWNPFNEFHIAKGIRPREYLTEEELKILITHDFKKQNLCYARDVFIFAALTGLAYIDVSELRPSNVVTINGVHWIMTKRHKSKIAFQVKLLEIPFDILRRYQREGNERYFCQMKYRTLANLVRKVVREAGITKHITMHCARHSFAMLALNKNIPIESVSCMLGHTNIATTQIYAKMTIGKLEADMTELEQKLQLS